MLERILQLNTQHPLNVVALECLVGYGNGVTRELAAVTLLRAYWDERETRIHMRRQLGGFPGENVRKLLLYLSSADPDEVMGLMIADPDGIETDVQRFREMDGPDIAASLLGTILANLRKGARLPRQVC